MAPPARLYDPAAFGAFTGQVRFDANGLAAAIAQQVGTGEILMLAWMNRESLRRTFEEGAAVYWSRSRGKLWRKGESSGQTQRLIDIRLDCDGDAILLIVDQTGVACHTGRRSCFYRAPRKCGLTALIDRTHPPEALYGTAPR